MSDPWCWASKRALQLIRDNCKNPATALSVYHALTEIDSDNGSTGVVEVSHKGISLRAAFSVRTVLQRLKDLERCGAIKIETPALKAPCKYTLHPISNGCATFGNGCRTIRTKSSDLDHSTKDRNKESTPPQPPQPQKPQKLSTPDRIGLEKKLEILRRREEDLASEIPDHLDQREHPEKVQELKALKAQRKALEDQLLANQ